MSGTNQYVALPSGLVQTCGDFTFGSWVNLAANGNWNRIFDFGTGTNTYMFLSPRANGAAVRFAIKNNGSAEQQITYNVDLSLNAWHHLGVVLNGNLGTLYLDGAAVATNPNITFDPANLGATPNNWLGRSQWASDAFFNGKLDDVRVSCRPYSAQEMAALAARAALTYEAETLTFTSNTTTQVTFEGAASGGQYVQLTGTPAVGAYIDFTLPNVPAGTYNVSMLYKSNNNRAIVQASIDGVNQGATCDQYAASPAYQVSCSLGSKTLAAGTHTIRFTAVGKNASSSGYMEVIDQIALQ
jgi:hypothetical protein